MIAMGYAMLIVTDHSKTGRQEVQLCLHFAYHVLVSVQTESDTSIIAGKKAIANNKRAVFIRFQLACD